MTTTQKEIFLQHEGNAWYKRNFSVLGDKTKGILFYESYLKSKDRILEIGCSNGHNLNSFHTRIGCECYGIDPSEQAIQEGKSRYPQVLLTVGTADKLDYPDNFFNFILFGFCLYLTDRHLLTKIIAEADRVLKNKAYLGITDFDSKIPKKRLYKHYADVMSYKMDYSSLFLAFPHFTLADKCCYAHASDQFVPDISQRVSSCVLYKDFDHAYFPEEDL